MKILLTNDDGHQSPLLPLVLDHLRQRGEVTVVVPAHEQSGTAKTLTIHRPLTLGEVTISGTRCYTLDGSPADCVQVGLHHLATDVDVVVSGINVGRNAGVYFMLWSGTVGAAVEANLQGVPAIALSQDLNPTFWHEWITYKRFQDAQGRFGPQTDELLERVFAATIDQPHEGPAPLWNVNLPFQPAEDCKIVQCAPGDPRVGSCFERDGDTLRFGLARMTPGQGENRTMAVLQEGHVPVNRLDLAGMWAQPRRVLA